MSAKPRRDEHAVRKATSCDVVALDIRQAIVALLLAKKIDVSGRWLDVYVTKGDDDRAVYVIMLARKLQVLMAEEVSTLLGRNLSENETSWKLSHEEIECLLKLSAEKLSTPESRSARAHHVSRSSVSLHQASLLILVRSIRCLDTTPNAAQPTRPPPWSPAGEYEAPGRATPSFAQCGSRETSRHGRPAASPSKLGRVNTIVY
jgi:hypothetical protein